MGASDYMVGNAPQGASYNAPNMSNFLANTIGNLPQDFSQGMDLQQKVAMKNAFPNGLPLGPNGQPDLGAIMGKFSQIGGGQYVQSLMPFLIQQQGAAQLGGALHGVNQSVEGDNSGYQPPQPNTSSRATPYGGPTGPASLSTQPQASPQRTASAAPGVTAPIGPGAEDLQVNGESVRDIVTKAMPGQDTQTIESVIGSVSRSKHLNPTAKLTPELASSVRSFLSGAVGVKTTENPPGPNGQPPENQNEGDGDRDYPFGEREANLTKLKNIDRAINAITEQMPAAKVYGQEEALKARLESLQKRRDQVVDYLSKGEQAEHEAALKNKELTGGQKEATDPNVLRAALEKKAGELKVASQEKDRGSYMKLANQADDERQQYGMAQKLINDPNFVAGWLSKSRDSFASMGQALGLGPKATPNQIFDKIRAGGILNQIKGMAGTGPVRVAEMKFIDTMMAGRENTPEALRAVITIQDRLAERSQQIRDIIRAHGNIVNDATEADIDKFKAQHKLFSEDEMGDPRLIQYPRFGSFGEAMQYAQKAGFSPDAWVVVNGKLLQPQRPQQ